MSKVKPQIGTIRGENWLCNPWDHEESPNFNL